MTLTAKRFGQKILESGLLTKQDVEKFWHAIPPDAKPKSAKEFAESLVAAKKLTNFRQMLLAGKTRHLLLGNYVLLEKIAVGGMGEVFLARHRVMNRLVALKTIAEQKVQSQEAVERFRREVRVVAQLEHANIVMAYDAAEAEGIHFLTMQYIRGSDLSSVVRDNGPLSVEQAVDVICQAARGLGYAHSCGVIHRDVKPSNLMVDEKGQVKVLDLGLATLEEKVLAPDGGRRHVPLTSSGQVMGTVDFMSPEQAVDLLSVDARSDVYSLGCTLYWLLTAQVPHPGKSTVETLLAHQSASVPSVRGCRDDIPGSLDSVVAKMMAKKPSGRQQTMQEVIDDLQNALDGFEPQDRRGVVPDLELGNFFKELAENPVDERTPRSGIRVQTDSLADAETVARQKIDRRTGPQVTPQRLALAVVAVLSVVGLLLVFFRPSDPHPLPPSPPPPVELTTRTVLTPRTGMPNGLSFSPDGRWLAVGEGSVLRFWRMDNGVGLTPRLGHVGSIADVAFLPNSLGVATVGQADGMVRISPSPADRSNPTVLDHGDSLYCVACSPDGRLLASAGNDGMIGLWTLGSEPTPHWLPGIGQSVEDMAFSTDGQWFAACGGDKEVRLWKPAVGATSRALLRGHKWPVTALAFFPAPRSSQAGSSTDQPWLVSAATDGVDSELIIWNLVNREIRQRLERPYKICRLAANGQGTLLVAGVQEAEWGRALTFRTDDWQEKEVMAAVPFDVLDVAVSADERHFAVGLKDGSIQIRNIDDGDKRFVLHGNCETTTCLAFMSDGQTLVSGGDEGMIKLWEVGDDRELATWPKVHESAISAVVELPRSTRIVSCDLQGKILVWNRDTKEVERTLHRTDSQPVYALAPSPDEKQVVAAGGNEQHAQLRIWNLATGQLESDLAGHTDVVSTVCYSPDGQTFATGSFDGSVRIWNTRQAALVRVFDDHQNAVRTVRYSNDGTMLASAGKDQVIHLRDMSSGSVHELVGHEDSVRALSFTSDDLHLISLDAKSTIRIWDVEQAVERQVIPGDMSGDARCFAISRNDAVLATADMNGPIVLHRMTWKNAERTLPAPQTDQQPYINTIFVFLAVNSQSWSLPRSSCDGCRPPR